MPAEAWGFAGVVAGGIIALVGTLTVGWWKRNDDYEAREGQVELDEAKDATAQFALGFQMWEGLFESVKDRLEAAEAKCERLEERLDATEARALRAEQHVEQCERELRSLRRLHGSEPTT